MITTTVMLHNKKHGVLVQKGHEVAGEIHGETSTFPQEFYFNATKSRLLTIISQHMSKLRWGVETIDLDVRVTPEKHSNPNAFC